MQLLKMRFDEIMALSEDGYKALLEKNIKNVWKKINDAASQGKRYIQYAFDMEIKSCDIEKFLKEMCIQGFKAKRMDVNLRSGCESIEISWYTDDRDTCEPDPKDETA